MGMICESIRIRFPNLTDTDAEVTSPATNQYNCIAWAAGEDHRWWWPDRNRFTSYWPGGVERTETKAAFVQAFETLGFVECENGDLAQGVEKIALFGNGPVGSERPTHAARQLESGNWTSKLGGLEDITHSRVDDLCGSAYGHVICFMSRIRSG